MTQTQQPAEPSRTAVRAARSAPSTGHWVALVVVLVGLFGMHGLAGHGTHAAEMGMGDAMVTMPTTAGTATGGHHAAMTNHLGPHVHAQPGGAAVELPGAVSGAMSGGAMSVLCLAVLTAGGLVLLLLVRTRRPRVTLVRMPAPSPPTFLEVGRERDPPSLTALSIRRC
jgi:hypothetical protein